MRAGRERQRDANRRIKRKNLREKSKEKIYLCIRGFAGRIKKQEKYEEIKASAYSKIEDAKILRKCQIRRRRRGRWRKRRRRRRMQGK